MSPPGIDELLQREIDGVNTPAESALLGERLAADARLAERFASLGRASAALAGAGRIAPPRELVDDVIRATRRLDADRGKSRPRWHERLGSLLAPAPLAACGATLVLGVVLGGLLPKDAGLLSHSEQAALSGTALGHDRLGAPAPADRLAIDRDGLEGEAAMRFDGRLVVLELRLDAAGPVDVRLDLAGSGLAPRSFAQDGPSGGDVVVSGDAVRFTHPAGRRRYVLAFARDGSPARLPRLRVGDGGGLALSFARQGTP